MEIEIINFIADNLGVKRESITKETLILDDLGLDGDDAVEFMEMFSNKFSVDLTEFKIKEYFGPEGLPIWFIFSWVIYFIRRILGQSTHEASWLKPLSVAQLINAAEKHRW